MRLDKLLPQHVQSLYKQKQEEGLSTNTVLVIHGMLHRALKSAVRWGLVSQNVCDSVEIPRKVRYQIHPLALEQTQKFLDTVPGHTNEALFVLAVATGMRRGELAGLKWQDVDLEQGVLHVRRSLVRVPTQMGGGYMEAEPKTEKSRRSIMFPDFASEALKAHNKRQQEIKSQAGNLWQEYDYVFCTPLGEHINPGRNILEEFKKLLKRAGLPDVRFHDLRHGAATMLLGMGIHPKIVQERLGHHDIGTTMDIYSHVLPTMQEGVMKLLAVCRRKGRSSNGSMGHGWQRQRRKYGTGSQAEQRWREKELEGCDSPHTAPENETAGSNSPLERFARALRCYDMPLSMRGFGSSTPGISTGCGSTVTAVSWITYGSV
jgi:integrase